MKSLLFLISLFSLSSPSYTDLPQSIATTQQTAPSRYPNVFIIGNEPKAFESLSLEYSTLLITACNDDLDLAFNNWVGLMGAIEDFAASKNYDIKGVKLWMKIFWGPNGKIDHIAYHPKPTSRNINTDGLTQILEQFMLSYRFPITFNGKYSHYGSGSFPVFHRTISRP
jgi:hypothetical protein